MVNVHNNFNFEQNYALTEIIFLQIYHGSNYKISIFEDGKPIFLLLYSARLHGLMAYAEKQ